MRIMTMLIKSFRDLRMKEWVLLMKLKEKENRLFMKLRKTTKKLQNSFKLIQKMLKTTVNYIPHFLVIIGKFDKDG
jgi:hypothetical protein